LKQDLYKDSEPNPSHLNQEELDLVNIRLLREKMKQKEPKPSYSANDELETFSDLIQGADISKETFLKDLKENP